MSLTVIVRTSLLGGDAPKSRGNEGEVRLTFDGTQRVVIGRGASSDVRLPDASVSHRHATLRAQGGDFLVVDEDSANGTFVWGVRVAAHTSRIVRSGDRVRVGRITLELLVEQAPATRDVSVATRDLALALVARAMRPEDRAARLRVVEGPDRGAALPLLETEHGYLIGRGTHCDLTLADADASREHARVVRRGAQVYVGDLGAKNGTQLGSARAPANEEVLWRPAHLLRIGRTVVALEEPVAEALADVEEAADEVLPPEEAAPPSEPRVSTEPRWSRAVPPLAPTSLAQEPAQAAAIAPTRPQGAGPGRTGRRGGWSAADFAVMAAAAAVLALSLAGLLWLLRGG